MVFSLGKSFDDSGQKVWPWQETGKELEQGIKDRAGRAAGWGRFRMAKVLEGGFGRGH